MSDWGRKSKFGDAIESFWSYLYGKLVTKLMCICWLCSVPLLLFTWFVQFLAFCCLIYWTRIVTSNILVYLLSRWLNLACLRRSCTVITSRRCGAYGPNRWLTWNPWWLICIFLRLSFLWSLFTALCINQFSLKLDLLNRILWWAIILSI